MLWDIKESDFAPHRDYLNSTKMSTAFPPEELKQVIQEIATLLKERKETISVAETAAGGLISASLLSFPGASGYHKGGLTLYTLESRIAFAGWTDEHIKSYKGPTPEIVTGLAEHTRKTLGSTYTVSESGTAGPTGGQTRNRTPGYCALAVAIDGKETATREIETGTSERETNMVRFALEGLKLVRDVIKGDGKL